MNTITEPRILIIDDIPDNVKALGATLTNEFEVQFAMSGPEGLALIRQHLPDLILLDVMMPDMDGYAVLAELKRDPKTQGIPVIIITAHSDADTEIKALEAGAVDFVHKPINPPIVRSRVRTHLTLKRHERELQCINDELEQRVVERTYELKQRSLQVEALNSALEERAVQAEAANLAKRDFLGNISHELRTPLNAIVGFTDLLQRTITDPAQLKKLTSVGKSASHLTALINQILYYTEIDSGKLILEPGDFDLCTLIQQVSDIVEPRAIAKNLAYSREIDPAIPRYLSGDTVKLEQVLLNLVANAVKFTEQGEVRVCAVLLKADRNAVDIRIDVQDTGIGIPPSKLDCIFEPFAQADTSLTRPYGGLGLGLSISRKLIEMMGGEIGVTSEAGQGSTFWVRFKLKPGNPPKTGLNLEQALLLLADHATAKILLVEDNYLLQEVFKDLLSEAGLEVDTAFNGAEAVAKVAAQTYDLIVMDLQLPILDGFEASLMIRAIPGREQTPIIALTGSVSKEDEQRCHEAGMLAFLMKPVFPEALFHAVATGLEQHKKRQV